MKRLMLTLVILSGMLLTGCGFSKTVYLKQTVPPLPAKPDYYSFEVDENLCMDETNAKHLLKNKALVDDYIRQLEAIIEGMR